MVARLWPERECPKHQEGHAGGAQPRNTDLIRNLYASVLAYACNLGYAGMADASGISATSSRGPRSGTCVRRPCARRREHGRPPSEALHVTDTQSHYADAQHRLGLADEKDVPSPG